MTGDSQSECRSDELFCRTPEQDGDVLLRGDTASQTLMDCGSLSEFSDPALASIRSSPAPAQCSNGQKSKRSSSPGPHPVKTTCVAVHPPNPQPTCCASPRKGPSPDDVEMQSPNSPVNKTPLVNSSAGDGAACVEECAEALGDKSQYFVSEPDAACSAAGTGDSVLADCSDLSDVRQELITNQSGATCERYDISGRFLVNFNAKLNWGFF